MFGGHPVGNDFSGVDVLIVVNQRALIHAVPLVGSFVFLEVVDVHAFAFVRTDADRVRRDVGDSAGASGDLAVSGVVSRLGFHPGSDQRRFRLEQWHSLTLHVGAHQCAVGIVVFEEWNQRSRDGHNLFWRHVHEVDFFAVDGREVTVFADTAGDLFVDETVVFVQRFVGLGDRVFPFFVGGQVDDFVSGHAIDDAAVRRFDKAVFVDAGVNRQRPDQPDVRTFRGFNWAHSAVVGVVNVSHFKSGTFSGQTARPQCRQTALVGQF